MNIRIRHIWEVISSSYWFVPTVMTAGAGILASGMLYVDRNYLLEAGPIPWLYTGGSEGARTLLSTVAGSVITVAGVVFSITIAALTQASTQFGPRLLRNFMRDTSNQIVLGTFVATFLYCLLVLRTIHGKLEDGVAFVPHASVTTSVILAVASIAVLIYFIHHVSVSLQAPNVVAAALADLTRLMEQLAGGEEGAAEPVDRNHPPPGLPDDFENNSCIIPATCEGYIQAIDYFALLRVAAEADLILRLHYRPGDYIIHSADLMRGYPASRLSAERSASINKAFICGDHATSEQDVEYAVDQMVEIAVRALSPGINDPFTAINCINALGSAICRIARSGLPGPFRLDSNGKLRLIVPISTFEGITDAAFNQIRQYARGSVGVTLRLLEVIHDCIGQIEVEEQRQSLLRHAEMIYRQSQDAKSIPEEGDRYEVGKRWEAIIKAMNK